jgi:hypothetical protein
VVFKLASKRDAMEFIYFFHGRQFSYFDSTLIHLAILLDAYIDN